MVQVGQSADGVAIRIGPGQLGQAHLAETAGFIGNEEGLAPGLLHGGSQQTAQGIRTAARSIRNDELNALFRVGCSGIPILAFCAVAFGGVGAAAKQQTGRKNDRKQASLFHMIPPFF